MSTLAQAAYLDSEPGALTELPSAGSSLENPYVYDSAARELKELAAKGLLKIVDERAHGDAAKPLISRISFVRIR